MTDAFYGEDLAYVHHTAYGGFAAGAAAGLLTMLRRVRISTGLVVDLGCGSGIWARELLRSGYAVLGVDRSAAILDIARGVAPGADFVAESIHQVEIPPCAAVTAIGEGLAYYVDENAPDLGFIATRVDDALRPGGLFVFDLILARTGAPLRYHARAEGADWRMETTMEEDPARSLITRHIRLIRRIDGVERCSEEVHRVRTFSRREVEAVLRERGFTVRVHRRYGDWPLLPRRLAFRARKR